MKRTIRRRSALAASTNLLIAPYVRSPTAGFESPIMDADKITTESANLSTLPPNSIIDAGRGRWTLAASPINGLQMVYNGTVQAYTSNVKLALYFNKTMYYANTKNDWFVYHTAWSASTDPRTIESPDGTSVTTSDSAIVDSSLDLWTLVDATSIGWQIARNHIVDPLTHGVVLLYYANHLLYQQNSQGEWWSKTRSSDTWTATTDPRINKTLVAVPLGAYVSTWLGNSGSQEPGLTWRTHWARFVAALGRTPTITSIPINSSVSGQDNSPKSWPGSARYNVDNMLASTGLTPRSITLMIPWPFGYNNSSIGGYKGDIFSGMAAGAFDTDITSTLTIFKDAGYRKLYLRPAWEFNIGFALSIVTPSNVATFIAAFQHFYAVCKNYAAANGMNIRIIWNVSCPNPSVLPDSWTPTGLTIAQLYPGPPNYPTLDGCDSIGCDNYAESGVDTSKVSNSTTIFYVSTMVALAIARNKTLCFPEMGGTSTRVSATPSGLTSAWVSDCVRYLTRIGATVPIEFISLWDVADMGWKHNTEFTYASQYPDNPAIIAAWRAGLGPSGTIRTIPTP